jgi:hypothetical protein
MNISFINRDQPELFSHHSIGAGCFMNELLKKLREDLRSDRMANEVADQVMADLQTMVALL